ncbi:hypothetical protein ANTQUA_LOCUS1490 [Anthophora quadrimaculata]
MGSIRVDPGGWFTGKRDLHIDHVLRESRDVKWDSVACHWPHSCCGLHVLMAGRVQLLPAAEVRQNEHPNWPIRKTVQLSTTLRNESLIFLFANQLIKPFSF